ncbi:CDF family Co(II)/Ni(II) efflux transporter DmeF [Pseudobdellovibrio exovorus]|uniref:Cation efflux protein transmembrane domain-containing protein n=1 Tax=Pseudobdellovibrio exovorus JSS TaxID=1184267 RepID=M4V5Q3_9BACT|nr:CDF family Co(II)/Ni(II) efflux transporter DmeF [Pseudobdellovibrio exovorus]AGH94493.1 hypothetical protein A11Q_273 [Pseudobdellovibrio exovorus JSS]
MDLSQKPNTAQAIHDGHDYVVQDNQLGKNEKKTFLVVILTFITMVVEISYGYITGSMALLADGWHMASHVGALGISLVVYRLAQSQSLNKKLSFGAGKLIPLGGYTSALMLGLVAVFMAVESFERLLNPVAISFNTAVTVAVVGLVVNIMSVLLLMDSHSHHDHEDHHQHEAHHEGEDHDHDHIHDHNHRSALLHVMADALTSILAIGALLVGRYFGWMWADPLIGILGSLVILKWAFGLAQDTVWELLDGNSKLIKGEEIRKLFAEDVNVKIADLHVWRIAPSAHACELVIHGQELRGTDYYRQRILEKFNIQHLIIEERVSTWPST